LEGLLEKGKEIYDEGVENGEIRGAGCLYVSGKCASSGDYSQKTNVWREGKGSDAAVSLILDFVPGVGDVKGLIEAVRGKDTLTNEELSTLERLLSLVALGEIKGIAKGSKKAIKSIKMLGKSDEVVLVLSDGTKVVTKNSDIAKATVKNGDEAASTAKNALKISAGKNFKEHFIKHKYLLEKVTGNKYASYKEPQIFFGDIEKLIQNGTVKYTGKGTLNKGSDVMNIYRGKGITIVTKADGEWVTILETGKGMDLNIRFK
jgi:hypothetical protein